MSSQSLFPMGLPDVVSTSDLEQLLGLSRSSIASLERKGIIDRVGHGRYPLIPTVSRYCAHLREAAAGRAPDERRLTLEEERARLARAQTEKVETENARLRKELLPAVEVDAAMEASFARVKASLLQMIPRLAQDGHNKDVATLRKIIRQRVNEALEELAETHIHDDNQGLDADDAASA